MRAYLVEILRSDDRGSETAVQVVGSERPDLAEKIACLELVMRLADDGWTIAAHGDTVIGRLAQRAADASGASLVDLDQNVALRLGGANALPIMTGLSSEGLSR